MSTEFDILSSFPAAPEVEAVARLVLMPLGHGIETLAIAVIGRFGDGMAFARPVVSAPLACLPNDLGAAVFSFGGIVAADYLRNAELSVQAVWEPPLVGLHVSEEFLADGHDKESAIAAALSTCALYAQRDKVAPAVCPLVPRGQDEIRFLSSVRKVVLERRPALQDSFGKKFNLSGHGPGGEIDFVGNHYATTFAAINPKSKGKLRTTRASAALWNLARARDAFGFAAPQLIELTAWIPPKGLPIYSQSEYAAVDEVVEELTAQARREELEVFAASDTGVACRRLLSVEASHLPS